MKTVKSPEDVEVTPSKKKLKQARLPFKLLSDVTPVSESPQTRKRKLSAPEAEPVTKVGRISKENDTVQDSVVISDDDSTDASKLQKEDKTVNPFVKLVDSAWKKKLQRSKSSKKKKNSKKAREDSESKNTDIKEKDTSECMDVDSADDDKIADDNNKSLDASLSDISTTAVNGEQENLDEDNSSANAENKKNDVIVLEDSNSLPATIAPNNEAETSMSQTEDECKEKAEVSDQDSNTNKPDPETTPVTPQRSSRNRNKAEKKTDLNKSQSSIHDKSVDLDQTTPKQNTRSSSISSNQDVSLNNSSTLTPKRQAQRNLESAKKKEEREKEKLERERKKQQEKEEKAKQKLEKDEQKKREREEKEEAKRKEKEEKEEQRKKEKEEKDRQKELEKKLREEKEKQKRKEKEEKEEIRRKEKEAKEEEKRKKQEALELEKLEQEQKKKKAAEAFVNFFVPKQKNEKDQHTIGPVSKNSMLSSFTIKSDMRLAPTTRHYISDDQKQTLDDFLKQQNISNNSLYIKSLKIGTSKPMSCGATWPLNDKENDDDDVMIVEDDLPPIDNADEILASEPTIREKLRPKLLSFHENRRPPYWGTWRKRSAFIKPRRPFHQDQKHLDYEVDSDEEWEEEQEGESIDGSAAGSDDEQEADEYEVDNEVFVPHGYLSDEEATMDEDDVLSLSPETQKARLKHLEDEFEFELKKPTEKLKPRIYGPLWETADGQKPERCVDALWNYFTKLSMIMNDPTPLLQPSVEPEETEKKKIKKKKVTPEGESSPSSTEKKKKAKQEVKEAKKTKPESKKNIQEAKKSQPGINTFLTKLKSP